MQYYDSAKTITLSDFITDEDLGDIIQYTADSIDGSDISNYNSWITFTSRSTGTIEFNPSSDKTLSY